MRILRHMVFVMAVSALVAGCATPQRSKSGRYQSSYFNPHPAPANMSPPHMDADPVLDITHLRTQADYHYAIGEAYSMDGESERAIEEFKLVTIYDPQSAAVRLRLAAEYLKQGLLTESVEQAEQGIQLDPSNMEVRIFLGRLYSALKMYRQAEQQYYAVLQQNPKHEDVPIYLGALYAEQEKYGNAIKHFELVAGTKDHPRRHLAYYYIGKVYGTKLATHSADKNRTPASEEKIGDKSSADFRNAEKAYSQALQVKPDFEEGALALFDLYVFTGQKEKGARVLESFQTQFGPQKAVSYQLSQHYLDIENYDMAMKHLTDIEAFDPSNLNAKMRMALILIEQKKYPDAVVKLEEILRVTPSSDRARFYLAAIYEEIGKHDLAIRNFNKIDPTSTYYADAMVHAAFLQRKSSDLYAATLTMERAIRVRDDVAKFYSFYASLMDERKEYTKGISMLEKAIVKFPDSTELRFYLGSLYDRVGKVGNTIEEMRRVISIDGDHVQALNYLAYTYAEQNKNLDEAEELARKAMNLQPGDPYILDTVGWVLFKQGRAEEAIQYLEAAHKIKPDEAIVAEHLGDAYYVFELTEKAKMMYQKAVASETDQSRKAKIQSKINSIAMQKPSERRSPAQAP